MKIPNKLNTDIIQSNPELCIVGNNINVYLDGVLQDFIYEYDIERGYVDKHQMKRHNHGCEVFYTSIGLNGRSLINRLFGKVEVKWKS